MPSIRGLATIAALTTVENKQQQKQRKTHYDSKILDIESKYFTAADCNKFASQILDAQIKQKRKDQQINLLSLDSSTMLIQIKEVATLARNAEFKAGEDEIIKLQASI